MPLILNSEKEHVWLNENSTPSDLLDIVKPFEEGKLIAYSVPKLRGNNAVGNVEQTIQEKQYQELPDVLGSGDELQGSLF